MKFFKTKKKYIGITILILVLSSIYFFNDFKNRIIEKPLYITKELDQEGQTYRLVTSADNVQVPVPKGYVASQVTGENYVTPQYQHTIITHKVLSTPTVLTWSSPPGEQYPWTQDENGIWISGNQGISNSTSILESEEFYHIKGTPLTINYTYSCEDLGNTDFMDIDLIDVTNNRQSNLLYRIHGNTSSSFNYTTSNSTYSKNDLGTGRYKLRVTYKKNSSVNQGLDSVYIKASTYIKEDENGTEIFEEDVKTRIHDGGFVIYQLTDEELETDPNGTSIIINDTNKDEAQATRNQYVWIPVPNIEDIVRTNTENNEIMQFGQIYTFSSTSINKTTSTSEPRLVERTDKTKYNLQKFSYVDKQRENYFNNMQEEYNRMIKSINKYKGFYIGRYETGDEISHSESISYYKKPKIVRYNGNIDYITWYDSYIDLKRLPGKTGEYVETGIIYSSLFDYTLIWLKETEARSYEEIRTDSGIWGNFYNNSIKYKTSANGTQNTRNPYRTARVPTGGVTEIIYKGEILNNSPTASNNIFDIAGNMYENTMSRSYYSNRTTRGGDYGDRSYSDLACTSYGNFVDTGRGGFGTRGMLVIK